MHAAEGHRPLLHSPVSTAAKGTAIDDSDNMDTASSPRAHDVADPAARSMAHAILVYAVALVPTLPLFLILRPFIPALRMAPWEGVRVDQFLLFLLLLVAFIVLVQRFQRIVFATLVSALLALTITSLTGSYGFGDLVRGYSGLMRELWWTRWTAGVTKKLSRKPSRPTDSVWT